MKTEQEKRRGKRHNLSIKISRVAHPVNGDVVTEICETLNISEGGAYCISDKPFGEFLRVQLSLEIPSADGVQVETIECSGIVVREGGKVQVGEKEMYAFAVYFDQISDDNRYMLIGYLSDQE
jgi:hypothetical protein